MKKLFTAFLLAAGLAGTARAQSTAQKKSDTQKTHVDISMGLRKNDFNWNIASDLSGRETPNILSELSWKNIQTVEAGVHATRLVPLKFARWSKGIRVEAEAKYGKTVKGENQDSDYYGDNRTDEFSRSNNNSSSGYTASASGTLGYSFNIASGVSATPFYGFGWSLQQYKMTDGYVTVSSIYQGPFSGLNSSYTAQWQGHFAGLELNAEKNRHSLSLRGEYHYWLKYKGESVWNLRTDLQQDPSFLHVAYATGVKLKAEYAYACSRHGKIVIGVVSNERHATPGLDTTYFSSGSTHENRFNEANDKSASLYLAYRVGF